MFFLNSGPNTLENSTEEVLTVEQKFVLSESFREFLKGLPMLEHTSQESVEKFLMAIRESETMTPECIHELLLLINR